MLKTVIQNHHLALKFLYRSFRSQSPFGTAQHWNARETSRQQLRFIS
jgi:hypothetical protein